MNSEKSRMELDRTDLRLLRELQKNGRATITELADKVALSPTACQRRVRKLEDSGVIERYMAVLSPAALGHEIEAFVRVSIERQSKDLTQTFEEAVQKRPEIRACYVMTGDLDFLLHVFVAEGSVHLGERLLQVDDAARLTDEGGREVGAEAPTQLVVWAFG